MTSRLGRNIARIPLLFAACAAIAAPTAEGRGVASAFTSLDGVKLTLSGPPVSKYAMSVGKCGETPTVWMPVMPFGIAVNDGGSEGWAAKPAIGTQYSVVASGSDVVAFGAFLTLTNGSETWTVSLNAGDQHSCKKLGSQTPIVWFAVSGAKNLVPTGGGTAEVSTVGASIVVTLHGARPESPKAYLAPRLTERLVAGDLLTGLPVVDQTLQASTGRWRNTPTGFSYQWQRCNRAATACSNVGANKSDYKISGDDVGSHLRVVVQASNSGGAASTTSNMSAAVTRPLSFYDQVDLLLRVHTQANYRRIWDMVIGPSFVNDPGEMTVMRERLAQALNGHNYACVRGVILRFLRGKQTVADSVKTFGTLASAIEVIPLDVEFSPVVAVGWVTELLRTHRQVEGLIGAAAKVAYAANASYVPTYLAMCPTP